jgi:regulator of protease activity HflC (stomatin/prohibitin superfamily)
MKCIYTWYDIIFSMTEIIEYITLIIAVVITTGILLSGIKIIRPTHRGIVETLGKYSRFQNSGVTFIIPLIQRLHTVLITETLIDVEQQVVITKDNLNCNVDAQVYYKVKEDEQSVKDVFYKVTNYETQITQLAKSTMRNIIGDKEFQTVNSKRAELNKAVFDSIATEIEPWGIGIIRVELKEIVPPADVQGTMNTVIKAQNDKQSAVDFANAVETKADGERRARIKEAEGKKKSLELEAEGQANAIKFVAEARAKEIELVNKAADEFFVGNAKELKNLEVTQASLQYNSKIILTKDGIEPTLVINEGAGIVPIKSQRQVNE